MNLTIFNQLDFLPALREFFKVLQVPIAAVTDKPIAARDILENNYKDNESFRLIDEVYFLGMVDDAAFRGGKSLDISQIKSDYDGILIFGVTLRGRDGGLLPTRSQLAEISRAFNREFCYTPVVVVFKYADANNTFLAFANTERLKYKDNREGEKAGKVTLLRDIDIRQPHSGHERILANLAIATTGKNKVDSFASLYKYWQEVLSVSLLNKDFYKDLSNWYFWAVGRVTFPSEPTLLEAQAKKVSLEDLQKEHKSKNVIRLLTRLLFVWFIKEKGLIPPELFELDDLQRDILKNISPYNDLGLFKQLNQESIYYKAILQNLFFATLNCPIKPMESHDNRVRGFRKNEYYGQNRDANFLMRYREHFQNPDQFVDMVNSVVPFLNGGLFECLDDKTNNIFIDGFSDNLPKNEQLIVPDYLFFGVEEKVNLSAEYGVTNKATKEAAVTGLINILKAYKFTITENTPIEEDVALDPELLGKVFENLLASYNPETKTTARKQTGSFYTPREIVNYMVDESLIAYLKNELLAQESGYQEEDLDRRLRQLVSFDAVNPFAENAEVQKRIIKALDKCTILDPACGSGAFPMGILQKMVHILFKVDPKNTEWKQRQIARVEAAISQLEELDDAQYREQGIQDLNAQIKDIEEAFANNELDYGRKLYLIENCIYGVDIQSIATQISKLRFFISLVVDQKVDPKSENNFGIRPLPNLETKFVAANTLIGIEKPKAQLSLFNTPEIKKLEADLKKVRHRLFSSKSPNHKRKLRDQDKDLREQIAAVLQKNGWKTDTANKLANWDPYNLNNSASFFDAEWMFDIVNGFDIVIGNPPYVRIQELNQSQPDQVEYYKNNYVAAKKGNYDIYVVFVESGLNLLSDKGNVAFILPHKFFNSQYGEGLRKTITKGNHLRKIVHFGDQQVFNSATTYTCLLFLNKYKTNQFEFIKVENPLEWLETNKASSRIFKSIDINNLEWNFIVGDSANVFNLISNCPTKLVDISKRIFQGLVTGADKVFILNNLEDNLVYSEATNKTYRLEKELLHPLCKGSLNIRRYHVDNVDKSILFPYQIVNEKAQLISEYEFCTLYPKAWEYLLENRQTLENRENGKWKHTSWYALGRSQNLSEMDQVKILTPSIASFSSFLLDFNSLYFIGSGGGGGGGYGITLKENIEVSYEYVLGLLNSQILDFYLKNISTPFRGGYYAYNRQYIEQLPIHIAPKTERKIIELIVSFILYFYTVIEKSSDYIGMIQAFEKIIDAIVFELYYSEHMKEKKIDVLQFIQRDIEEVMQGKVFENLDDVAKQKVIKQLYAKWTDPDNEVRDRIKLFAVRSPDILKPILESK